MDQIAVMIGLLGGLAIFLFGLDILTRALKLVAGSSMRSLLERMTRSRLTGLLAGATVTAIIQSSSVTTVLVVGFISAGLMTSAQSVAVIIGANIGTTITAQILAFKVTALAMPLLTLGFFVSFVTSNDRIAEYGRIVLGLGLVFFGMALMGDAMRPLRSDETFLAFIRSLDSVLLAALVGAGFTALVQSSSATTGIVIVMASQGLITLEPAIALAMGANVGTCITALLASLGKPRAAIRAALVHTLFNVVGVLIWIGFISELAGLARLIGPGAADDIPRQLANVHTAFNVANALLFIGFTGQIARLSEWILPDREDGEEDAGARHLDPDLLKVPVIALDAARREVVHLAERTRDLVADAVPAVVSGSHLDLKRLRDADRPIDLLHRAIVAYLREVSEETLPAGDAARLVHLLAIANDLEHIGDIVATGLVTSAEKRMNDDVVISTETVRVLRGLHQQCLAAIDGAVRALKDEDEAAARNVREMKATFADRRAAIATHQLTRLRANDPKRLQAYARESELAELFDDIFRIIRRVARAEIALFSKAPELVTEDAVLDHGQADEPPAPVEAIAEPGEPR